MIYLFIFMGVCCGKLNKEIYSDVDNDHESKTLGRISWLI